jgi:tetratricopeptide (TPR) repeat protein
MAQDQNLLYRSSVQELSRIRALLTTAPNDALTGVGQYLAGNPRDPEALRIAAAAHRLLGQRDLAERAEIAALDAGKEEPAIDEIVRLIDQREFGEASRLAAAHLQRWPDDLCAATLSAETAIALGLPERAIPMLEGVLLRAPSYLLARTLLISALTSIDRLRDARAVLEPVVRRMPDSARFQELLAKIAANQGDFGTAIEASAAVTRLDPKSAEAWLNHGDNLRFGGRTRDAVAAYRSALRAVPDHGRAWWSLADIDASALDVGDVAAMRRAMERREGDPEHLCNLQFALGSSEHARGNHAQAFAFFSAGNLTRRSAEAPDHDVVSGQVDHYLDKITADLIPQLAEPVEGRPTPFFIVGMPRSGSTLLERVLGRHSKIEALGELPIVPHMVDRMKRAFADNDIGHLISELAGAELAQMGKWYVARASELAKQATPKPYFTDKMHMNWRHLPLILRMLPDARVIDVRRSAMDCCWSNYRTLFARGHPAANDLTDIGRFYRDYVRLTDGMRDRAPTRVHTVQYEDLVDDFEGGLRRLFAVLDLDFEPGVDEFHLSHAPVATASSEQVRQPLNRNGIGAWRPYSKWLDPLREALGDLAES